MPSQNNLIIKSLTNTLQSGVVDSAKLYDLLNRMNQDLNLAYNTVIDGPLPAIDGFNLTRLNADSLVGTRFPDTFRIAYLDDLNEFTRGQMITQPDVEEPFWTFGIGDVFAPTDPTSFFRLYATADGFFGLSQNALYDGVNYVRDDSGFGAIGFDIYDGIIDYFWWDSGLNDFRNTWSLRGRELGILNFANDGTLVSLALVDDNDVIHLGESAATDTTPSGYITLPSKISTEIPLDGDADNDGIICTDKTLKYLVAYISGRRYRVALTLYP